jgi:hypothetical protein
MKDYSGHFIEDLDVISWLAVYVDASVKRKTAGKYIVRCEFLYGSDRRGDTGDMRCNMWANDKVDGHFLCSGHILRLKNGRPMKYTEGRSVMEDAVDVILGLKKAVPIGEAIG